MAHWQIETKNLLVEFLPFENKGFIQVSLYDKDRSMFANLTKIEVIYIPCNDENVKKLQSYKSISALVKYARANQIQQQAVTPVPVPAPAPAKSSEQVRGIFLSIETTGTGKDAEIVEIAILDNHQNMLYTSLVKPTKPITSIATAKHGINNYMVAHAPTFAEIWKDLQNTIGISVIVMYNADFVSRAILQSCAKSFDHPEIQNFRALFPRTTRFCLMKYYAKDYGQWSDYHQCHKWQTLTKSCIEQDINCGDVAIRRASGSVVLMSRLYSKLKERKEAIA